MESAEVYGKATVPGLTYQPRPRSPTRRRGFPATGEGGRAEGRGQKRGETDKNHLSLMQWATSRSRGQRSEDQRTSGRGPGERPKPEPAPSWRGVHMGGEVRVHWAEKTQQQE